MNKSQKVSMYIEREWDAYVRQIQRINSVLTAEQIHTFFYPSYTYGVGVGMQIEKDLADAPLGSSNPMELGDVAS